MLCHALYSCEINFFGFVLSEHIVKTTCSMALHHFTYFAIYVTIKGMCSILFVMLCYVLFGDYLAFL